jgi:hypothetical protein
MIFKTKKYWIGVAVFSAPWLILCVLGYLFFLQPQANRYKTVHQELTASNDRVSVARMAALEDTRHRQADLLVELQARLGEYLVTPDQQDRVLFEISRLANTYGLADYAGKSRQDLWGAEEGEQVKVQRMWLTLTFEAPFQQFAAFINAMERNAPTVFVESAGIERSRENPKQHRAKLLVAFFTRPETKAASKTAAASTNTEGSSS